MKEQAGPAKYGRLRLTRSWIIKRSWFPTWVDPMKDLVWAYKKVTRHSVNFIPTGKTYAAVIIGRGRQREEDTMKENAVHALLAELASRVPWAVYGYSQEIDQHWQKDPAGLIVAVDARRQQTLP